MKYVIPIEWNPVRFCYQLGTVQRARSEQEVESIRLRIMDKSPKAKIEVVDEYTEEVVESLMEKYEVEQVYGPPPKMERPWV